MIVEERTDAAWKELLVRLTPMVHTQRNRILIPTSFFPIR